MKPQRIPVVEGLGALPPARRETFLASGFAGWGGRPLARWRRWRDRRRKLRAAIERAVAWVKSGWRP